MIIFADCYSILSFQLTHSNLEYSWNFGAKNSFGLPSIPLNSSLSYLIDFERFGLFSRLSLDDIAASPYTIQRQGNVDEPQYMQMRNDGMIVGAGTLPAQFDNDFQGK